MSLHSNGLPMRVLDFLEADGGSLTTEGLALAVDAKPDSVYTALKRLETRGFVSSRILELARSRSDERGRLDSRREWRFESWGDS